MSTKSEQLQIRITSDQKATLRRLAREAGQDLSGYVLARVLPEAGAAFRRLVAGVSTSGDHRLPLAELNDALAGFTGGQLADAVAVTPPEFGSLSPFLQNYVAAMVEQTAHGHDVPPPAWVRDVDALEDPYFATTLGSLRLYLIGAAPVAFKRRNIFIDSGVGARV